MNAKLCSIAGLCTLFWIGAATYSVGQEPAPPAPKQEPVATQPATTERAPAESPIGREEGEKPAEHSRMRQDTPPSLTVDVKLPPPPFDSSLFKITSGIDLVVLDVSVKDGNGGFVSELDKDNFQVFEDNKPQKIVAFGKQDIPVTVGLIVDSSGSVRRKRPEVVTAALTFVQQSHPQDEMFVVNFNDNIVFGLPKEKPFSDNVNELRAALLGNPVEGRTAIHDALRVALAHIEKGRMDKKTLVVVSDGGDTASNTTEDEVLRLAQESLVTIYTIGIYDPDAKDKNRGFLKELANITGGEFFEPERDENIVKACEKIAKDIRNRYTLAYTPADVKLDGKVRKIRVVATAPNRGKLAVRTRAEYIALAKNTSPAAAVMPAPSKNKNKAR
jgi:Ca-activated chloride channel family protein